MSGPAEPDASGTGDIVAEMAVGTQEVASAFPINPNKAVKYDGSRFRSAEPIETARRVTGAARAAWYRRHHGRADDVADMAGPAFQHVDTKTPGSHRIPS